MQEWQRCSHQRMFVLDGQGCGAKPRQVIFDARQNFHHLRHFATVIFDIWHENAPERYRNGHFGWRVKEGSTCTIDAGTTISTNQFDARSCIAADGHAFIRMNISNPDPDADCSFDITGLVVSNEF